MLCALRLSDYILGASETESRRAKIQAPVAKARTRQLHFRTFGVELVLTNAELRILKRSSSKYITELMRNYGDGKHGDPLYHLQARLSLLECRCSALTFIHLRLDFGREGDTNQENGFRV